MINTKSILAIKIPEHYVLQQYFVVWCPTWFLIKLNQAFKKDIYIYLVIILNQVIIDPNPIFKLLDIQEKYSLLQEYIMWESC